MNKSVNALLIACFLMLSAGTSSAQMGKLDTKHVSDNSFCVVHIDVGRLASHLQQKSRKDFEKLSREMAEDAALELTNIKSITFQYGDWDIGEGEPSFAITIDLEEKIDQEEFLNRAFGPGELSEAVLNGKSYWKPQRKSGPHVYFETDRKFTVATPAAIESVMNAGTGMGKMSSLLKSAPPGSEVIAVFERSEKFQESVRDFMRSLKGMPSPLPIGELVEKGQSGIVYLNLKSGNPLMAKLTMDTKESADGLHAGLTALVALGKQGLPTTKAFVEKEIKDLESQDRVPDLPLEMLKSGLQGLKMAELALGGLTLAAKDKTVEIKVTHMGGMIELSDLMVAGFTATFFGMGSADDVPAPAIEDDVVPAKKSVKK